MLCAIVRGMSEAPVLDPVLVRLKKELQALYGPRLKKVLLYGSRARGDFREDSDYDVLVVLEGPFHWWDEVKRLSDLSVEILDATLGQGKPAVISFKPMTEDETRQRTGFMHNVRNEGITL